MYTVEHLTMQQIADRLGYSKCYIGQRLNAAGIDAKQGTWVDVKCHSCGNEFKEKRCKAKRASRRQVIGQYFVMPEGAIVHHEDGDDLNNNPFNLRAFVSRSDHLKYHHGVNPVDPIWDGRSLSREALADVA